MVEVIPNKLRVIHFPLRYSDITRGLRTSNLSSRIRRMACQHFSALQPNGMQKRKYQLMRIRVSSSEFRMLTDIIFSFRRNVWF